MKEEAEKGDKHGRVVAMPNAPIPPGWMTVQEAVTASGMTEDMVRKIARGIRRDSSYTIMGVTLESLQKMKRNHGIVGLRDETPESLPVRQGQRTQIAPPRAADPECRDGRMVEAR